MGGVLRGQEAAVVMLVVAVVVLAGQPVAAAPELVVVVVVAVHFPGPGSSSAALVQTKPDSRDRGGDR